MSEVRVVALDEGRDGHFVSAQQPVGFTRRRSAQIHRLDSPQFGPIRARGGADVDVDASVVRRHEPLRRSERERPNASPPRPFGQSAFDGLAYRNVASSLAPFETSHNVDVAVTNVYGVIVACGSAMTDSNRDVQLGNAVANADSQSLDPPRSSLIGRRKVGLERRHSTGGETREPMRRPAGSLGDEADESDKVAPQRTATRVDEATGDEVRQETVSNDGDGDGDGEGDESEEGLTTPRFGQSGSEAEAEAEARVEEVRRPILICFLRGLGRPRPAVESVSLPRSEIRMASCLGSPRIRTSLRPTVGRSAKRRLLRTCRRDQVRPRAE
ncbi:unnamed protein product [Protopolystoma xenopodis]|uniref:Uncharacterized protein n=1 Tax=Protopolystoma xenopodis TaxID=117903 RepID=A0A3S5FG92_9PLAT|nr:unnamed protein product [Protopolystoma xenopodis]